MIFIVPSPIIPKVYAFYIVLKALPGEESQPHIYTHEDVL